jgi:alpha-glucuronidase
LDWDYKLSSGKTLWEELCYKYYEGVDSVRRMQKTWESLAQYVDKDRFNHVKALLLIQEQEAVMWRDACLLYFQTFSKRPIPEGLEKPEFSLEHYKRVIDSYIPDDLK